MKEPVDERLEEALAELEGATASPGFTRRVLARIDQPPSPRGRRTALWAAAAAAIVAALAAGWWRLDPSAPAVDEDLSRTAERLRAEHRLLEAELEELRRQADEALAVMELASGDDVDLVLDLRPAALARRERRGASVLPVEAIERR